MLETRDRTIRGIRDLGTIPCDSDALCISIPNKEIEELLDELLEEANRTPTA